MIVNHYRRWVFIEVPKAGSTSLAHVLSSPIFGGENYYGDKHEMKVPVEWCDYFTFTCVRDPFERAASMWRFFEHGLDWLNFCRLLRDRDVPDIHLYWTQSEWLDYGGARLNAILHLGHIESELTSLGLHSKSFSVPMLNCTNQVKPEWTTETTELVREWASEDCQRFGYHYDKTGDFHYGIPAKKQD